MGDGAGAGLDVAVQGTFAGGRHHPAQLLCGDCESFLRRLAVLFVHMTGDHHHAVKTRPAGKVDDAGEQ
ncbi:MAG: hypothetical protein O2782_23280, partial [bacterium]|nr:hypothetical protein [bacterium]